MYINVSIILNNFLSSREILKGHKLVSPGWRHAESPYDDPLWWALFKGRALMVSPYLKGGSPYGEPICKGGEPLWWGIALHTRTLGCRALRYLLPPYPRPTLGDQHNGRRRFSSQSCNYFLFSFPGPMNLFSSYTLLLDVIYVYFQIINGSSAMNSN